MIREIRQKTIKPLGIVFDIQGFSIHDGPGCRTVIFLKGCTLKCKWCSNPEGILPYPEPIYTKSKCIYDKLCIESCPLNAISTIKNVLKINRRLCKICSSHNCEIACCTGALKIVGYKISLPEIFRIIRRDQEYWGENGGVTLTGGEPFFQHEFTTEILKYCRKKYINTVVETCGNIPWENIEKALPFIDWIFYDIKHVDPIKHKKGTGSNNNLILENAKKLAEKYCGRLIFRTVIIPNYNDSKKDVVQLAKILSNFKRNKIEINILPLHNLGREKYSKLGIKYFNPSLSVPANKSMQKIKQILETFDFICYIGNDTPF